MTPTNGRYNHGKEIGALQSDVKGLKKSVDTILTNHLPHIEKRLDKLEQKLAYWAGAIMALTVILKYI